MTFEEDIRDAINRHSQENLSNTPDFILASYLMDCMNAFDMAVNHRERWYGREVPGEGAVAVGPNATGANALVLDRQEQK